MTVHHRRGRHPADPTGKLYTDTHWPLPDRYDKEPAMNITINRETMTFIARGEYKTIWDKALKVAPSESIVIGEAERNRTYTCFTDCELKMLYRNTTGYQYEGQDYNAMLQSCKTLGLQVPETPYAEGLVNKSLATRRVATKAVTGPIKPPTKKAGGEGSQAMRPKEGSTTGKVWAIADLVLEDMVNSDIKAIRSEVIKRCVEAGINPATAQVQYGKWKGSKNL